jgi:outer membrane protein insertion porin family
MALSQDIAGLGADLKYLARRSGRSTTTRFSLTLSRLLALMSAMSPAMVAKPSRSTSGSSRAARRSAGFQIAGVGPRDTVSEVSLGAQFYAIGTYQVRLPQILPEDYGIALSWFTDFGTAGLITGVNKTCTARVQCIKDDLGLRIATGIAVNWRSPFGPVEIDFGVPILMNDYDKPQVIRFSAGTAF